MKEAIFGDGKIVYDVLLHHLRRLPKSEVQVAWQREGDFIVGRVAVGNELFIAQGRSANEFVEGVNDALYAAYDVPAKYAEQLGGDYRLVPPKEEFDALNDKAIMKSHPVFKPLPA